MKDDIFCNIPYSSVVINPDGSYRLCSLTNSFDYDMGGCIDEETGVEMNVMTHSFEQAMNSKWHKELRRYHQQDKKHPMCECCYNRDAIGGDSRRQHLKRYLPSISPDYVNAQTAKAQTKDDGTFYGNLISLDLRFGNLCNLACITCGPWYSDKWYSDFEAINKTSKFNWNGKIIDIKDGMRLGEKVGAAPWWESSIWWNRFDRAMPNLRHLYVTAGEPMLVKAFHVMLERLVYSGYASNVIIEMDTNLTALNPLVIDQFKNFKRVDLRISVDETEERYDVFRYPGHFNVLDKNIKELVGRRYPNIDLLLTSCITPLNVFSIQRIEQYSKNIGVSRDAHFRFVDTPGHLDIRNLSTKKKDFMLKFLRTQTGSKWAGRVTKYLEQHYLTYSQHHEQRFVEIMDQLDTLRNHDWKSTFPYARQMFDIK